MWGILIYTGRNQILNLSVTELTRAFQILNLPDANLLHISIWGILIYTGQNSLPEHARRGWWSFKAGRGEVTEGCSRRV